MAKIKIDDKVGLGDYIRQMVKSDSEKAKFADPQKAKEILGRFTDDPLPDNVTIVAHFDSEFVTHVMVPWEVDIAETEADIGNYRFPEEYRTIDPTTDPERAYNFRVGDYVLTRCG